MSYAEGPKTFEFRRQEMAILGGVDASTISDDEVVDNFLHDASASDGALHQYLEHGSIAWRVGNTLFVHGAVDRRNMRFVPEATSRYIRRQPNPYQHEHTISCYPNRVDNLGQNKQFFPS